MNMFHGVMTTTEEYIIVSTELVFESLPARLAGLARWLHLRHHLQSHSPLGTPEDRKGPPAVVT